MGAFISPSLIRYQKVILSLVQVADHEKIGEIVKKACKQHFPSALPSVYQGVTIEIQRLSKPCKRKIDLRDYFSQCEPYIHNKITHYLDEESKHTLIDELEKYDDTLNLVTYHKIIDQAKERHQSLLNGENRPKVRSDHDLMVPKKLINTLFCESKQLSYSSDAYFSTEVNPLGMSKEDFIPLSTPSELVRVGHGLIRIKHSNPDVNPKWLFITNHHRNIKNEGKDIPSLRLAVQKIRSTRHSESSYFVDLRVDTDSTRALDKEALEIYIESRLAANNENLYEQFEPLRSSIMAKAHKQWWSSQTKTLTIFCNTKKSETKPLFTLKNSGNSDLFEFLSKDRSVVDKLPSLALPGILGSEDNISKIGVAYIDGSYYFETRGDFLSTHLWREAVRQKQAVLLGVFANKTKNTEELTHTPSALPSHMGPEFAVLNHPAPAYIKDETKEINTLFHFSELNSLVDSFPKELNTDAFSSFILSTATKHEKDKAKTKICNVFGGDLRNEERFVCELKVLIEKSSSKSLKSPLNFNGGNGSTINISANGLKVKTNPPFPEFEAGEDVMVSIQLNLGSKKQILARQPYKIVGIHKNELRLVYEGAGASSFMADRIISQYIYRNFDELTKNIDHQDGNYALTESLINILAHKTVDTPFFVMQDKKQWYPSGVVINNEIDFEFKNGETLTNLRRFFFSPKIREIYMTALNSLTSDCSQKTLYLVANIKDQSWGRELKKLAAESSTHSVLKRMKNQKDCRVFKLTISKTPKLIHKHLNTESTRLRRVSKELSIELDSYLDNTVGVGCIEDVTSETKSLLSSHKAFG